MYLWRFKMNQSYYVYYLIDPRDCQPFYVGKGKDDRMFVHEREVKGNWKNSNKPHHIRIRDILSEGLSITYDKILINVTERQALNREREVIQQLGRFRNGTGILLNISSGGSHGGASEKSVNQYDMSGTLLNTFPSAKIASESTPANRSYITQCCKGRRKSAGGFIWSYTDSLVSPQPYRKQYEREVLQFTVEGVLIQGHRSVTAAAKIVNRSVHALSSACRGVSATCAGYVWKYQ